MVENIADFLATGSRSKIEIIAAIIALTHKPRAFTLIKEKINLNHKLAKNYLELMQEHELVESQLLKQKDVSYTTVFQTTQKGLDFLETYCQILAIIYGKNYLEKTENFAIKCIKYCKTN